MPCCTVQSARERFKNYVTMAQKEKDRKDLALTLKKMLSFNALVVTPLLTKIKGVESAAKALADAMIKAQQSECRPMSAKAVFCQHFLLSQSV